jgi:hypothetical protein
MPKRVSRSMRVIHQKKKHFTKGVSYNNEDRTLKFKETPNRSLFVHHSSENKNNNLPPQNVAQNESNFKKQRKSSTI